MKWRPSPVTCERIADSQDGRYRIVWRQCEPPQHEGWPPIAAEVFVLWRLKPARLVGAYETLAAAIQAAKPQVGTLARESAANASAG